MLIVRLHSLHSRIYKTNKQKNCIFSLSAVSALKKWAHKLSTVAYFYVGTVFPYFFWKFVELYIVQCHWSFHNHGVFMTWSNHVTVSNKIQTFLQLWFNDINECFQSPSVNIFAWFRTRKYNYLLLQTSSCSFLKFLLFLWLFLAIFFFLKKFHCSFRPIELWMR